MRVVGIVLLAIFLIPVCLIAGVFGGCLVGALFSAATSNMPFAGLIAGVAVGLGGAVALFVLAMRSITSSSRIR